jgi:hypothetical protein
MAALVALCLAAAGCTTTSNKVAKEAPISWTANSGKRVLLLDPDVELSELTAGGMTEARADWTQTGRDLMRTQVGAAFSKKGIETSQAEAFTDPREAQLMKLHTAIGNAMMINEVVALPTKKNGFDWTLGPGVNVLRDRYKSDYALFVHVRDSYTSAGRAMLMLGAAVLGVGVQGGRQVGFASLVDLRTGRIVWFNRLASSGGDLKTDKGAINTVNHLLTGMPL